MRTLDTLSYIAVYEQLCFSSYHFIELAARVMASQVFSNERNARAKKRAAIVLARANARRETMARYMMSFHIGYYVASGNTNQHFAGITLTRCVFRSDLDLLRGLPIPACVSREQDLDTPVNLLQSSSIRPNVSVNVNRLLFPTEYFVEC